MQLKRWFITLGGCLTVLIALAGIKGMQISAMIAFAESFPEPSESVESAYSATQPYRKTLTVIGNVSAPQYITLHTEAAGRVEVVGFKPGERVEKDQVLLQMDVSEETARLNAAEARLTLAQNIFKRADKLFESGAVSEETYDRARAELAAIKAEVARLNSLIRKKTVIAPFAGQTGIYHFEVGQFVSDNILVTELVGETSDLWVDFKVPQFYPLLSIGTPVEIQQLRHDGERQWVSATIIARSNDVDNRNRSVTYRARVSVEDLPISINSGVSVRVPVSAAVETIVIPVTAVQQDNLGEYVFLLEPDNEANGYRAQRQPVSVISKQNKTAFIREGLNENQLIATDGAFKLHPGLLVFTEAPEPVAASLPQQNAAN